MSRERRYVGLALVLALPMSQLGHGAAYLLQRLPSDHGVHAYFPSLFGAVEWTLAGAVLSALFVVGLARALNPGWAPSGRPVYFVPVVTAFLTAQLLIYLVQETLELASLGTAPSAALLAWGVAGQAPIALLAAAAVRWLSQCFEPALRALGVEFSNAFAVAPDASEAVPSATGAVLVSARVALLPALRAPPPSLTR